MRKFSKRLICGVEGKQNVSSDFQAGDLSLSCFLHLRKKEIRRENVPFIRIEFLGSLMSESSKFQGPDRLLPCWCPADAVTAAYVLLVRDGSATMCRAQDEGLFPVHGGEGKDDHLAFEKQQLGSPTMKWRIPSVRGHR